MAADDTTVRAADQLRSELEATIVNAIRDFEQQTGLAVTAIDIYKRTLLQLGAMPKSATERIAVTASLEN